MKYHKWKQLVGQYPWLISAIGIDPDDQGFTANELRSFVRNTLDYVAFRPFHTLNLETIRNDGRDTLEHRLVTDPYFDGDPNRWYEEHFEIFWHLSDRTDCSGEEVNWMSITAKIQEVKDWWLEHIKDAPERLMFDRVVKVTSEGVVGNQMPTKVSVDIYPFQPQNHWAFWPPTPPKEPLTYREHRDLEAHAAYVSGRPMPPIIPPVRAEAFA